MYDLLTIASNVNQEKVLQLINSYQLPPYPQDLSPLQNQNLSNLPKDIIPKYGITTNKAILFSHPTTKSYYSSPTDLYNRLKLTSIPINTSILIFHESLDHQYLFVMCNYYYGWLSKSQVYNCSFTEFTANLTKSHYLIITDSFFTHQDLIFDMGTKLDYLIKDKQIYAKVYMQTGLQLIPIPQSSVVLKPLKLNQHNIINQSLKYLDTPYSLGDDNFAIDCSSMVRNILACFNYFIPRDTKDIIKYLNINHQLKEPGIKLLHFSGHIAIYLKYYHHHHYYIHANAKYGKVTINYLDSTYLSEKDLIGISIIK